MEPRQREAARAFYRYLHYAEQTDVDHVVEMFGISYAALHAYRITSVEHVRVLRRATDVLDEQQFIEMYNDPRKIVQAIKTLATSGAVPLYAHVRDLPLWKCFTDNKENIGPRQLGCLRSLERQERTLHRCCNRGVSAHDYVLWHMAPTAAIHVRV